MFTKLMKKLPIYWKTRSWISHRWERKLLKRYPEIFADVDKSPRESLMCFGLECGPGWSDTIDLLCKNLDEIRKRTGVDIRAAQVKEKWGGLRFYIVTEYPEGMDDEVVSEIGRHISSTIDMFEYVSYRVCESCGNNGEVRRGGWVKTLCSGCENKK